MVQIISWTFYNFSAGPDNFFFCETRFFYSAHKTHYFSDTHLNIFLPSACLFSQVVCSIVIFQQKFCMLISFIPCVLHFHPFKISLRFCFLGPVKLSMKVPWFFFKFCNMQGLFFNDEWFLDSGKSQVGKTIPFRLSATAYSTYISSVYISAGLLNSGMRTPVYLHDNRHT
jgi:hypothetical protein